jgi:uncharacterized protein YbaR (Trm112 family)
LTDCPENLRLEDEEDFRRFMAISPELLEILVCPKCKTKVELKADGKALKCANPECGLVYPVKDNIPVMLVEEAKVEK